MRYLLLIACFALQTVGHGANTHDLKESSFKKQLASIKSGSEARGYKQFRYYSPDTGTYISQDPIGLAGNNPNFYAYVKDSNSWVDPFGLECKKLDDDMASTFLGGKYSSRVLEEDLILYRAGKKGTPLGQFFSKDAPVSEIQTRIDKAILPVWPDGGKSILDTVYKIKIPKGTTIHTGKVAPQGDIFLGGTQQIVVEKPWLIKGVEVLESYPLII